MIHLLVYTKHSILSDAESRIMRTYRSLRYLKFLLLFIPAVVPLGTVLAGCSLDRWVEVEPGEYNFVQARGFTGKPNGAEIRQLFIDRKDKSVTFTLVNGNEIIRSFVPRDRREWPSGCPANIQSTRMEILDLEMQTLTSGTITLRNPILVRNCPSNPVQVVLREDDDIGGGGTACQVQDQCLIFGRSGDR